MEGHSRLFIYLGHLQPRLQGSNRPGWLREVPKPWQGHFQIENSMIQTDPEESGSLVERGACRGRTIKVLCKPTPLPYLHGYLSE